MRRRIVAGLGALAGLATGLVAGSFVAAAQISGPRRPDLTFTFTPYELDLAAERVDFVAADGVDLAAWWFPAPQSSHVVICCHGHRGNKQDVLGIAAALHRAGLAVFAFDFRGNGDSGDGPQSLAHFEQADLEAAVDWVARTRPDAEIDVIGYSMGAAVSLLVAARDPRVARVVADSPFADMRGVIAYAAEHRRVPPFPLVTFVEWATRARYGYRFAEVQPVDVVAQIPPRPLLLIHGTDDGVIPVEHARRLAATAGPGAELIIVDGVDHCGAYFADRAGYVARVLDFLTRPLDDAA